MRALPLLLLLTLESLAHSYGTESNKREHRDLLARSKRRWVLSTIELEEEQKGTYPKPISQMFNDKTAGVNHKFKISGEGVEEKIFSIDEATGIVYAHRAVDREVKEMYHIKFQVIDKDNDAPIDKELAFDVEVKDINDNPPQFHEPKITVNVKENTPEGYLPVQLQVFDRDKRNTPNSKISVSLVSQEPALPKINLHQLNDRLTQLRFTGCFDYDKIKQYKIIVQAKDFGTPSLTSTAEVLINIVDANSHPPKFKERQYHGEAHELTTADDILRISIVDEDSPNTDASRAKYFFIKGNEDDNFQLETDPKTNEGILSIIKGKNYDQLTLENLEIGVENIEPLFICKDGQPVDTSSLLQPDSVNITMTMIDANDPPVFEKEEALVYRKEEEEPGIVLYTPVVEDMDSNKLRYEIVEDPAGWVSIDSDTGVIKTIERLDRESPFVESNVYKVIVAAIDNGEPPSTGSSTILINLVDINDNSPQLVDSDVVICANKDDKVTLSAKDADADPFSGPFSFSLDGALSLVGEETTLTSLTQLAYGNYSVPLRMEDQQNQIALETINVVVCDCEDKNICRELLPPSASLGAAAIGLLIAGLLLFLLLLLIFACDSGKKAFEYLEPEEGNQTLIKYNQEGGGATCKAAPTPLLMQTNEGSMSDVLPREDTQTTQAVTKQQVDGYSSAFTMGYSNMQSMRLHQRDSFRSQKAQSSTWSAPRSKNYHHDSFSRQQQSSSFQSDVRIANHIERRLQTINGNSNLDQMCKYDYEGEGSRYHSLDELSLTNQDEDLHFLDDLGQRFKDLGSICHQSIQEKNVEL